MTDASDWTGRVGDVWAAEWPRTDRSFADLARHLDAAIRDATPIGPFRALDIGCGAGSTSLALAEVRPDAAIVGVDLSAGLVRVARARFAAATTLLPRRREPAAADGALGNPGLPPAREHDVVLEGLSPAKLGVTSDSGSDVSGNVSRDWPATNPTMLPRRREPRTTSDAFDNSGRPPAREHGVDWTNPSPETTFDHANAHAPRHKLVSVPHSSTPSPHLHPSPTPETCPPPIRFEAGDAPTIATAHAPFDLLYSRHGVMFFDDPAGGFAALRAAAAPGARLIFSCFADWSENAFASAIADVLDLSPPTPRAAGPFAFADQGYVADLLANAGWADAEATVVRFNYRAGQGEGDAAVADALSFFQRIGPAAGPLRAAAPALRAAMLHRLTAVMNAHRFGNAVDFPALAWIWSATADRPIDTDPTAQESQA